MIAGDSDIVLDLWKQVTTDQFVASLGALDACIECCADAEWHSRVANMTFDQVVFHTLFFTDCYLSVGTDEMLAQPFHADNRSFFRDYEELEDRAQENRYERAGILRYLSFCREKACVVIAAETEGSLSGPSGFSWLAFPRCGVHVYNIRHIQHHAGALSLHLRGRTGTGTRWVKAGWPG